MSQRDKTLFNGLFETRPKDSRRKLGWVVTLFVSYLDLAKQEEIG